MITNSEYLRQRRITIASVLVSLILIGGVAAQRMLGPTRADAEPYLMRIRTAAKDTPMNLGDWQGKEQPVPPAAIAMLRPNVLISRSYTDLTGGRSAGWLFVHCSDARDLGGHYPPICYPNSGWVLASSEVRELKVNDWTVHATEYSFTTQPFRGRQSLTVIDTMAMPDGAFHADIDSVRSAAAGLTRRYWGASQIQVVMDSTMPRHLRDEIAVSLIAAHADVIKAVLNVQQSSNPPLDAAAASGEGKRNP
jgi:hypothetical protein